jgi:serine-type D-Ala-D-Ala carboxypeptidase (penicillin-binding protein 5/6)
VTSDPRRSEAGSSTPDDVPLGPSPRARWRAGLVALALTLGAAGPALAQAPGGDTAPPAQTVADGETAPADDPAAGDGTTADVPAPTSSLVAPEPPLLGPAPDGWPAPSTAPATAYVLMDAATGQVLAARNAQEPRAVASTVKVLTALSVEARTDLDDPVTVGEEVAGVPGSGVGIVPGNTWSVEQLLDAVISRSGNEAAEALAVHVGGTTEGFVEMMLADAEALGLGSPPLVSPSGLDDANQLSAMDLATLARVALADEQLRPFFGRREVVLPSVGRVETRNRLLLSYPDATGVKTGFTLEAGTSLIGSARRDGRELIAVLLDAGDDPARFVGAANLLDLGFDDYRAAALEAELEFAVAGGRVTVDVDETPLLTPSGTPARLRVPVTARPPERDVEVDVEVAGDVLATVTGHLDTTAGPGPASDDAAVGRAMVDGAYAALRAATAQDVLR